MMNCPFKNILQWQCLGEHTVLHEIIDENMLVKCDALPFHLSLPSGYVVYIAINKYINIYTFI